MIFEYCDINTYEYDTTIHTAHLPYSIGHPHQSIKPMYVHVELYLLPTRRCCKRGRGLLPQMEAIAATAASTVNSSSRSSSDGDLTSLALILPYLDVETTLACGARWLRPLYANKTTNLNMKKKQFPNSKAVTSHISGASKLKTQNSYGNGERLIGLALD